MPTKCRCRCDEQVTYAGDIREECAKSLFPHLQKDTQEYIKTVQPGQHKYNHKIRNFNLSKGRKEYTIQKIRFMANNMKEGEDTFENDDGDWIFCASAARLSDWQAS